MTFLVGLSFLAVNLASGQSTNWLPDPLFLVIACGATGSAGGVLYCLRGVYLNACVRDQWNEKWKPWYFIRPVVSFLSGAISYVFVRAGLILLEAEPETEASHLGLYAVAFIAGLNVDRFIEKLEEIAANVWGIKKSRASGGTENGKS